MKNSSSSSHLLFSFVLKESIQQEKMKLKCSTEGQSSTTMKVGLVLQWATVASAFAFSPSTTPPKLSTRLRAEPTLLKAPSSSTSSPPSASVSLAEELKDQFPILSVRGGGDRPLVYLDSAATSQKPLVVSRAQVKPGGAASDHYSVLSADALLSYSTPNDTILLAS